MTGLPSPDPRDAVTSARLAWRIAFFAGMAAVLCLALLPQPPRALDTGWDKLNHVLAFAALALAGRFGFASAGWQRLRLPLALLGFGIAIELLQAGTTTRSAEVGDLLADALGIASGLALAAAASWLRRRRVQGL